MSERWADGDRLYHAALAEARESRRAFPERACAGDEALRQEVESLLAQPASVPGFLDRPVVAVVAGGRKFRVWGSRT